MALSMVPWLVAAVLALAGGVTALLLHGRLPKSLRAAPLLLAGLAIAAIVAGLILRAFLFKASPGGSVADALALLALGALFGGLALLRLSDGASPRVACGANLLAVSAVAAAAWFVAWQQGRALQDGASDPFLVVRNVFAGLGLGAAMPVAIASLLFALARRAEHSEDATESGFPRHGRPIDAGRLAAVAGYPFLTGAFIFAILWNLRMYATPWRTAQADLWMLAAWLLGAAYLHSTSPWRPLSLPAWVAPVLAGAAFVTALLSSLTAGTLLVG